MSATYAEFMSDPDRTEVYVMEANAYDLVNEAETTLYFGTTYGRTSYATGSGDTPANQLFEARMASGYSRQSGLAGGQTSARHAAGFMARSYEGRVRLTQSHGDLDLGTAACMNGLPLRSYSFGGRRAIIKHGGTCKYGDVAYADFRVIENGVFNGEPLNAPSYVDFSIKGRDGLFDVPIQDKTFWGTNLCGFFNGTSAFIDCGTDGGTSSDLNFTSELFCISFMIFIEAYPAAQKAIISRGSTSTDGWSVELTTSGRPVIRTSQSGATQTTNGGIIPLGRWVQVDISRVTTALFDIDIDGVRSINSAGTHIDPASANRNLYIGRNNGGAQFLEAALDEIRISGSFVQSSVRDERLHRPLQSSDYSAYLVYLNLDDGAGAVTADNLGSTGSASDGAITDVEIVVSCMGKADLEGRRMPDVWGEVHGWTPVQVDFATQTYMIHSSLCESVDEVMLGGYKDAYTLGTAYTSWFLFIQGSTSPGEYDTMLGGGWSFIRLGGQPNYKLTVDVKGDKEGGTYRSTIADILRYLVCNRGSDPLVDPDDIDDAAWDDLAADKTGAVGLAYFDDRSIKDVIDAFCRTCGLWTFFKRADGLLTVRQLDDPSAGTPVADLTEYNVELNNLQVMDRGAPAWLVIGRYNECPTVMGDGDLYEGIPDTDADFYRRQWRKTRIPRRRLNRQYLDAIQYEFEMRYIEQSAAHTEVTRQSRLLATPDQAFSFFCPTLSVDIELLDVVSFSYHDLDSYNREQNRFNTSASAYFYITAIREDAKRGGYVLELWRPGVE